jgi:MFS family permease
VSTHSTEKWERDDPHRHPRRPRLPCFAIASAIGGASVSFAMLVTARAWQGVFSATMAPAALSLLATTLTGPKDRGKAFGDTFLILCSIPQTSKDLLP